jgi:uncharacterized protein HemY
MKEPGESKDHEAPTSDSGTSRRPPAHAVPVPDIGTEPGKVEFEPDALLENLFEETGAPPAPPAVGQREPFAPVPVPSSIPPATGPHFPDDDEQTSVFWRDLGSSSPPVLAKRSLFDSEPPASGEGFEPESFLPPPGNDDSEPAAAEDGGHLSSFPSEPDEAERTVRRSSEPGRAPAGRVAASALRPPELPRRRADPPEAERTVRRTIEPIAEPLPSEPPEAPFPPDPPEAERTVRRTLEPVGATLPSQPPEAEEAERTVRRSIGSLSPTLLPNRAPTRSSAAPPLLEEAGVAHDPLSQAAWVQRAEWLESEAQAAPTQEAKARALVVASELWALAGNVSRGREVSIEAAAIGRSASLGDRQLRWLSALEGDFDSVVTALEAEQLGAATPEARAHAAYLAAEVSRLVQNDDARGKQRHEAAARAHPEDPRPQLMRLLEQLATSSASPKLKWPDRPEFDELSRATEELARLRSPIGAASGTPLGSFEDARQALAVGERIHAANSVLELSRLEGMGTAPYWLSAVLLAADDRTRGEAFGLFERLATGVTDSNARRALARHALSANDAGALERALASDGNALPAEDRLALSLLAGTRGPVLELALEQLSAGEAGHALVAAAMLAAEAPSLADLPLAASPERDALSLGRALARDRGDPLAASGEIGRALADYGRSNPAQPLAGQLELELAVLRGDAPVIAARLGTWAAPEADAEALRDRELAQAFVHELGGDGMSARAAYERAFELDPSCEPAARAMIEELPRSQASELLLRLADNESQGTRAAVHFLQAALVAEANELELFEPAIERAKEADPGFFISYRLGEERAQELMDVERRLGWIRARRAQLEDRSELALTLVREALLTADADVDATAALLKEAFDAAPDDVALVDLYLRFAAKDEAGRGALWQGLAERAEPPLSTELFLIAALEHERENDRSAAFRASDRARREREDEANRVLFARLALGSEGAEALSEALRARLSSSVDAREKRELCQQLSELERARDDTGAALAWQRASVEHDPIYLPALRALEQAALRAGDRDALPAIEAALAPLLSGADAAAAAELAVRFLSPDSPVELARGLAELALEQHPDALWALRLAAADAGAAPPRIFAAYRELSTLATRPLDRATLSLRAAEAAARIGQLSEARRLLDQSLNEVPDHLVALTTLAELLERASDPAEAARAFETLAEASRVDAHKAAAFQRAAVLWLDQANDPDRGLSALEQAASIDITHEEAVLRLQSIYVTRGERHKLAELLLRRVESSSDSDERMALEVARSRVLSEVGEHASARAALSAALDAQPDHLEALEAFADLCLGEGDWASAEQALLRLSRHATTAEQQADVYRRLAELYDTTLPNAERAELAYREVLRRMPDDTQTVERLIGVYGRLGRRDDAVALASEFLERAPTPEARRERTAQFAIVLERVAGDRKQAETVLEKARREAPHDARLLRALVDLRRRGGEDPQARALLERAASDARRALGTGRFEIAFFETLATVAELKGQPEAARIAQSTLASLVGTELPLVGAGPGAGDSALDDLLAPELLDPRIRKLIRGAGAVLDAAYPADLRALRATPLPPGSLAYYAHAQKVAESFGLDSIEILVSPSVGMNCVPLSSAPARLLVGPELLKSSDDAVRFALLVRALKLLEVGAPVIARTSPVELVPLMGGLVASLVPDGTPQPGVDVRKAREATARIAPVLSPALAEELSPLAREIAPLVSTRSSQLGGALLQWASRTALLAVGDLNTVITAAARASGAPSGPPSSGPERLRFIVRNAEARDVSIFSVSEHYAEARKRMDLGG